MTMTKEKPREYIKVQTVRHGECEIPKDKILEFPAGLLGFREASQFAIMEDDQGLPVKWLQCVDQPELAFLVTEPRHFFSDYEIEIPNEVQRALDIETEEQVLILLILTIRKKQELITANLQGPIIINIENQKGRQLILQVEKYSTVFPIIDLKQTMGEIENDPNTQHGLEGEPC